jgi:hypothetical protein
MNLFALDNTRKKNRNTCINRVNLLASFFHMKHNGSFSSCPLASVLKWREVER